MCLCCCDHGVRQADTVHSKERAYFCLHFARGMCCRGVECTFYHRIPTAEDDG